MKVLTIDGGRKQLLLDALAKSAHLDGVKGGKTLVLQTFKDHYRDVKAEQKGEARPTARRIKTFSELRGKLAAGVVFALCRGEYYYDEHGTIRRHPNRIRGKAAVRAAKRSRRYDATGRRIL